jgi:hypothetical protein
MPIVVREIMNEELDANGVKESGCRTAAAAVAPFLTSASPPRALGNPRAELTSRSDGARASSW